LGERKVAFRDGGTDLAAGNVVDFFHVFDVNVVFFAPGEHEAFSSLSVFPEGGAFS
jgi:hypothetical protein